MPIYRLQRMHITSLRRHLLSNVFENVNLSSSYNGLSPHQIWFNLEKGKQSYGGGWNLPPQVENVLNRPGEKKNYSTDLSHFASAQSLRTAYLYKKHW